MSDPFNGRPDDLLSILEEQLSKFEHIQESIQSSASKMAGPDAKFDCEKGGGEILEADPRSTIDTRLHLHVRQTSPRPVYACHRTIATTSSRILLW